MAYVRSNTDTVSQGLKCLRKKAKRHHISMGTTHKNAYVERGERKAEGLMLGVNGEICSI